MMGHGYENRIYGKPALGLVRPIARIGLWGGGGGSRSGREPLGLARLWPD